MYGLKPVPSLKRGFRLVEILLGSGRFKENLAGTEKA
jgi:hypothetical protein